MLGRLSCRTGVSSRWVPTARGHVVRWVSGTRERDCHTQTRDTTVTRLSQALLHPQVSVVYNQSCQNVHPLGMHTQESCPEVPPGLYDDLNYS